MPVLGITGGIATGKTLFTRALLRALPEAEVFDADACARELATNNEGVRQAIREHFGVEIFAPGGELQRAKLREIVFHDESSRRALERILHPAIRETWARRAEKLRGEKRWFFVDIPLLFETSAEKLFDAAVVVACSAGTQRRRLMELRRLPLSIAEKIVGAQMPLNTKIGVADHVIWNDGGLEAVEEQAALFSSYLKLRYG